MKRLAATPIAPAALAKNTKNAVAAWPDGKNLPTFDPIGPAFKAEVFDQFCPNGYSYRLEEEFF
jgi:hypothetical protein